MFATKTDGKLRFFVDYRNLNAMTVRYTYPLPPMDECTHSLGDATNFSTIDGNSGCRQIEIPEANRDKTIFLATMSCSDLSERRLD